MKSYQINLTAQQVAVLFEMCDGCSSIIHAESRLESLPESFNLVQSIQDKLDGCEDLSSTAPSLLDQIAEEVPPSIVFLPEIKKHIEDIRVAWRAANPPTEPRDGLDILDSHPNTSPSMKLNKCPCPFHVPPHPRLARDSEGRPCKAITLRGSQ